MKLLITEQKILKTIEGFLFKNYPGIISVDFDTYRYGRYEGGVFQPKDSIKIEIVFGENTIPDTNIERMRLKGDIEKIIKTMFGINKLKLVFYHLEKSIF